MPSVRGSMSTKTGSKPQCSTAAMSDTQVIVGTMTSPPGRAAPCRAASVSRLADEPELTKTLCWTPSQSRPFLLEGADLARLRQDRIVLAQQSRRRRRGLRGAMLFFISGQSRPAGAVARSSIIRTAP